MSSAPERGVEGRVEEALRRLSAPPNEGGAGWGLHHGVRALLLLLMAGLVTFSFPPGPSSQLARFEVGTVADQDIVATIPFDVPKNRDELERERQAAAASVPPTFRVDPEAAIRMEEALYRFFDGAAAAASTESPEAALAQLLEDRGMPPTPGRIDQLQRSASRIQMASAAVEAVRAYLPSGVMDDAARVEAYVGRVLVVEPEGGERYVLRDSVRTSREFFEAAMARMGTTTPPDAQDVVRLALIHFFSPSLRFDEEATESERDTARRAVPTSRVSVLEGEVLVRANQLIGTGEVERLRAFEEALRTRGGLEEMGSRLLPVLGGFGINLLLLGVFGAFLLLYRPEVYGNLRWLLLQASLIVVYVGAGGLISRQGLPAELLPIAFVSLGAAVLWDGRMALVLAVCLAALTGAQPIFQSVHAWLPVFAAGATAGLSVRAMRRRAQTWVYIALIAGAYAVTILFLGLLTGRDPARVALGILWASGNAVVSAILVMGFLPVFEWFTRITTDQTLLEWADPNRPLLKRLSVEAPGTYAHTINVANLSEAAANAVGANGLLCRVGVYYHDVGKILKPQFFIENQLGGRNPHDQLTPATSAAIVREHVTEGLQLAREAKLPEVLVRFIPEHHGTQEIAYFLDRARKAAPEGETPDPQLFRYPGPRPQSRETAIVMLADSVESATRTVQDPTQARMAELIETIVDGKIRGGQLEEAPLTLRELGLIKGAFLKVLSGLYHQRIDYPETRHITGATGPSSAPEPEAEPSEPASLPEATPEDPPLERASMASPRKEKPRPSEPQPLLFPIDDPA